MYKNPVLRSIVTLKCSKTKQKNSLVLCKEETPECCRALQRFTCCKLLTIFSSDLSTGPHEKAPFSPGGKIQNKKKRDWRGLLTSAELHCVVSKRLESGTDRRTAVTYAAKASSLAQKLIKPLTIIPTKPRPNAFQGVCKKAQQRTES